MSQDLFLLLDFQEDSSALHKCPRSLSLSLSSQVVSPPLSEGFEVLFHQPEVLLILTQCQTVPDKVTKTGFGNIVQEMAIGTL